MGVALDLGGDGPFHRGRRHAGQTGDAFQVAQGQQAFSPQFHQGRLGVGLGAVGRNRRRQQQTPFERAHGGRSIGTGQTRDQGTGHLDTGAVPHGGGEAALQHVHGAGGFRVGRLQRIGADPPDILVRRRIGPFHGFRVEGLGQRHGLLRQSGGGDQGKNRQGQAQLISAGGHH